MKKVIVAGGEGFVGREITKHLVEKGYKVIVAGVNPPIFKHKNLRFVKTDFLRKVNQDKNFKNPYGVINLIGEGAGGYKSKRGGRRVYALKIKRIENLMKLLNLRDFSPSVLLSVSNIDYCKQHLSEGLSGGSVVARNICHCPLCYSLEKFISSNSPLETRSCTFRSGFILSNRGGFFKKIVSWYRFGFGGFKGSSREYFPWISLEDLASMHIKALENDNWEGVINAVSPGEVTSREFFHTVSEALQKTILFFVPSVFVSLLFGSFYRKIMFNQKIYPEKAMRLDFVYKFRSLNTFVYSKIKK